MLTRGVWFAQNACKMQMIALNTCFHRNLQNNIYNLCDLLIHIK